jgi:hypothetical protein
MMMIDHYPIKSGVSGSSGESGSPNARDNQPPFTPENCMVGLYKEGGPCTIAQSIGFPYIERQEGCGYDSSPE